MEHRARLSVRTPPRPSGLERLLTERLVSRHVEPALPRVETAVELGPGRYPVLRGIEGGFRRIGVDPEPVEEARRHFDELLAGSAEALPLPAASADLVVARWVLEHVGDGRAALAEIARVLRPGGVFAFLTPNRRYPLFFANFCLQAVLPFPVARRLASSLAGRPEGEVYRAYYRLSTASTLARLWAPYGRAVIELVEGNAYGLDLRALTSGPLSGLRPYLLGRLER